MFAKRAREQGIVFVEDYVPGRRMKDQILDGDRVELKIDEERVLIRDVSILDGGKYRGFVYGFEPSFRLELMGVSIGDQVEFFDENVFGCGR